MIITIAGDPGSGKSTLGRMLATRLDIPFFSMGDIFREMAVSQGKTVEEFSRLAEQDPELYDRKVDEYQAELPEKHGSFIIDSRLGFHFLPDSIKICLTVDREEAARRLMDQSRDEELWDSAEEGVRQLEERQESERKRYMDLYGIDHTERSHYDLVIDTTGLTALEKFAQVLDYLRSRGIEVPE